ncbi:major histocompatibility complex class I-related gene protein-like [Poeciliopsis prolifica]|uniref:major histocompatibility complex class I-related gene protein-like n=1 Tax=Poeciliopsis prolifica TaxID=188132 RepID=UPI0024142770|nr:major histocompatibility complex class I-related gene protein-like [Poeciliopsis prolifica]
MKMLFFLLLCGASSPEKHSLTVLVTASSGLPHFPDFITTTQVDKLPTSYCDSNKNIRANPKYGPKLMNIESQIADWYIEQCFEIMSDYLKVKMGILKDLNQSEAVHILQVIIGCEWEAKTKETVSFLQFGYNGADFIKFDPKKLTWIPQTPQAISIKPKWEADESTSHLERNKDFLNQICPDWLKKYMANNEGPLQSSVLPSVFFLQKSPDAAVSCFATGFYPNKAVMFWRKDGEEIHDNVDKTEILCNQDNTFQMRADINISSVNPEDWERYECVFHLVDVKDDVVNRLEKEKIQINWGKTQKQNDEEKPMGMIVGITAAVVSLVIIVAAVGFMVIKNRKAPVNSIELSERLNQETRLKLNLDSNS